MTFLSISIDVCGSTDAKAKLREHALQRNIDLMTQYEIFQKHVLRVESNFWTLLRGQELDINRLFLIKTIGDELWYSYDLNNLHDYEISASIAMMIRALTGLSSKNSMIVAGPEGDPNDWENEDPDDYIQLDLPTKVTIDVVSHALEMNDLRQKYLKPHVGALRFPLGAPAKFVAEGDVIDLCNRLGIYNGISRDGKLHSIVRSDFIGWEIDRFFRTTKAAIKNAVLVGPSILERFDTNDLIQTNGTEKPDHSQGWTVSEPTLRVPRGGGFKSIDDLIFNRRTIPASELKGVGADCPIAIVHWKFQQGVDLSL